MDKSYSSSLEPKAVASFRQAHGAVLEEQTQEKNNKNLHPHMIHYAVVHVHNTVVNTE